MRDTCLRCEQAGNVTKLVRTPRGGICPVHDATFLNRLYENAKLTLGIPLQLNQRGRPSRPGAK
jgi:hypothetical protein